MSCLSIFGILERFGALACVSFVRNLYVVLSIMSDMWSLMASLLVTASVSGVESCVSFW